MRLRVLVVATVASLAFVGGCSSDDSPASTNQNNDDTATTAAPAAGNGAAPTVCATAAAGDRPTVTIDVDDDSDGVGRFGLKTPSPLPAGQIRLALNAVEGNPDPVSVSVTSDDATVFEFVDVESGVVCGADVELAAGDYTVAFGAKTKTFTVDPHA